MSEYPTLEMVVERLPLVTVGKDDFTTTIGDFVLGFGKNIKEMKVMGRGLSVPSHTLHQLVRDYLQLPVAIYTDPDVSDSAKLLLMYDKAINKYRDEQITVRTARGMIQSITTSDAFADNKHLCATMLEFQHSGQLPEDVFVMANHISNDGRDMHMRLISPEWDFEMPERNGKSPYHGNLVVSNNELVSNGFEALVAVTRTSCLNSTIGRSIYEPNGQDVIGPLGNACVDLARLTHEMQLDLYEMQGINIANPEAIMGKLARELGLPDYATFAAKAYWDQDGRHSSLYDIVQAIAAGERELSLKHGRRGRVNYRTRTLAEQRTFGVANELRSSWRSGTAPEEWYLSGDSSMKYKIMKVIESYKDKSPVIDEILEKVEMVK